MTVTIWIMRHAETRLNKEKKFIGRTNPSLTNKGKKDAAKTGKWFADKKIIEIVSSPLNRSRQTAQIIAQQLPDKIPLRFEKRLAEQRFGKWEQKNRKQVEQHWKKTLEEWLQNPFHTTPPGGENYVELEKRTRALVTRIRKTNHSLLIVTHANILKILVKQLCGLTQKQTQKLSVMHHTLYRVNPQTKRYQTMELP